MAILTNISDQFGIAIEIPGRGHPGWTKAKAILQHYVEKVNQFQSWIEADLDIYETDLNLLKQCLNSFAGVRDGSKNFEFEPEVEPSFQLSLQRVPDQDDHHRVASLAIDLKSAFQMNVPSAYRENQIALRFYTDEQRLQRCIADLLAEIEGVA
jgi:hypothetical protein